MLNIGTDVNVLDSGIFSEVMDSLGLKKQVIVGFLRNHKGIKCLGRARTLEIITEETADENIRKGLTFLGTIQSDEILFVKGSKEFAYFGEMMTKLSTRIGIAGVVIDGLTRDTNYTHRDDVALPVLAKGYSPVDIKGRGRVERTDVPIEIDGVSIQVGDIVFIDNEAICVVPQKHEKDILEKVLEKVKEEARISSLISDNMSIEDMLKIVKEF